MANIKEAPDYDYEIVDGVYYHEGMTQAQEVIRSQSYYEDLETLDMLQGRENIKNIEDEVEVKAEAMRQSKQDFFIQEVKPMSVAFMREIQKATGRDDIIIDDNGRVWGLERVN